MVSLLYENDYVCVSLRAVRRLCCKSGKHSDLAADQQKLQKTLAKYSDDVDAARD